EVFLGRARHLDGIAAISLAGKGALAMEEGDLVFLEQIQDAVVVLLDHRVLAADQRIELQRHTLDLDAVVGKVMIDLFEMLGRLQQRLGRNATDVGARTAGSRPALPVLPGIDASDGHTELSGANGGDITAGAGTDDDDVKLFGHDVLGNWGIEETLVADRGAPAHARRARTRGRRQRGKGGRKPAGPAAYGPVRSGPPRQ